MGALVGGMVGRVKALFKNKVVLALLMTAIVVIVVVVRVPSGTTTPTLPPASVQLPDKFYILVDEPKDQDGMAFVAALSSIQWAGGSYHPLFVLDRGELDDHQLWTVSTMTGYAAPFVLFTNSEETRMSVEAQLGADMVTTYPATDGVLASFLGFNGAISVSSYAEAMWVAPLAQAEGKVIVLGQRTFLTQEDVWAELTAARGLKANYVVVANPDDWQLLPFNEYHIPKLSAVAAELAAGHTSPNEAEKAGTTALVLTRWEPKADDSVGYMDPALNADAIGLLLKLREMWAEYGPFEYVCLVGSAAAVRQFDFPDTTSTDPASVEGDGNVSCDVAYGYLDSDDKTMDAAVGRVVNLNVQGASNQIARTFGYAYIGDTVEVATPTGPQSVNWRNQVSIWNGFEVADKRLQMTPGWFMVRDSKDEQMSFDYMRTTGNSGVWDVIDGKEVDIQPVMEGSGLVVYRGHGSWHATFYVYEPNEQHTRGRLEGWVKIPGDPTPSVHNMHLPPSTAILVACENTKIEGMNFGTSKVDLDLSFPLNFFYGGGVGLIGASEVSFSRLGQDFYSWVGLVTKNPDWDLNNAMFAFNVDSFMDHEAEHGTVGKALQWAENRYIKDHNGQVDPLHQDPSGATWVSDLSAHWKTVAMYTALGDPAHAPSMSASGANGFDPWHNGAGDN